jgi:hypothetical protein
MKLLLCRNNATYTCWEGDEGPHGLVHDTIFQDTAVLTSEKEASFPDE